MFFAYPKGVTDPPHDIKKLLQLLCSSIIFLVILTASTSGIHVSAQKNSPGGRFSKINRRDTSSMEANISGFFPLLPPAIPLAVKSPYFSAWLATGREGGNGGYLAGRWAQFWPIQFPPIPSAYRLGWAGLIRVEGKTYEFMGNPNENDIGNANLRAEQIAFNYTASRSIFTFKAGPVHFLVTFLSTLPTQDDLLRQSLPFSYLSIEILQNQSPDFKPNEPIMVYTDIQSDWASGDPDVVATWSLSDSPQSLSYQVGRQDPLVFSEKNEYAEWGHAIYATKKIPGITTASGLASDLRSQFVSQGKLNGAQDREYRKISDRTAAFGYSVPLVPGGEPVVFAIGHVRDPYVQSIEKVKEGDKEGVMVPKWGYWRSKFSETSDAINFFLNDSSQAFQTAAVIDKQIEDDSRRLGGDNYVAITTLSARQAVGAMEITIGKNSAGEFDPSDVSAFLKEISSNGDMSTVDVLFPQFPIFAYLDPALIKHNLEPILKYSQSGLYPNRWTVHDLGRYPNATGHNDGGDEPMPVEEAGNMLIMVLSYYQLTKDVNWLSKYYKTLTQFAQFLIDDGLIPKQQLSSDDFAGKLENQTNLALKAIVGIGAMSQISLAVGDEKEGSKLRSTAEDYISQWTKLALTKDGKHTKLAYQLDDSWGTLYNLFADRMLNLKLVPQSIYETQDKFYGSVSNEFGVPLDSRHTWAKTDWQMFAAGAATSVQTRDLFTGSLVKYLKANSVNAGFPDLYETPDGQYPGRSANSTWKIQFINRPVVGGHFALLAADKALKVNGSKPLTFENNP